MDSVTGYCKTGILLILLSMAAQVAQAAGIDGVVMQFFGVPLTVIGMAAAGSMMSFAFGSTEKSRVRLFAVAIASTFIGAAAVTVVPAAFSFKWVNPVIEPPLAFFFALFARWLVPLLVEVLPAFLRKWTGTVPSKGDS